MGINGFGSFNYASMFNQQGVQGNYPPPPPPPPGGPQGINGQAPPPPPPPPQSQSSDFSLNGLDGLNLSSDALSSLSGGGVSSQIQQVLQSILSGGGTTF